MKVTVYKLYFCAICILVVRKTKAILKIVRSVLL